MPAQEPLPAIRVGSAASITAIPVDAQGNISDNLGGTIAVWSSLDSRIGLNASGPNDLTVNFTVPANIDTTVTPQFQVNVRCLVAGNVTITAGATIQLLPLLDTSPVGFVLVENNPIS